MINIEFSINEEDLKAAVEPKEKDKPASGRYKWDAGPVKPGDEIYSLEDPHVRGVALYSECGVWTVLTNMYGCSTEPGATLEEIAEDIALKTGKHVDIEPLMNCLTAEPCQEKEPKLDDNRLWWITRMMNKLVIIPKDLRKRFFGVEELADIIKMHDADTRRPVLEKICDNYIMLIPGDEVLITDPFTLATSGIYTHMTNTGLASVICSDGCTALFSLRDINRTGKHIIIDPLAEYLKGENNENKDN